MILWAAAIAHVTYGHDWAEALSLASACAAKFARAKGASLGLHSTASSSSSSSDDVHLLGSDVPCERTADGFGSAERVNTGTSRVASTLLIRRASTARSPRALASILARRGPHDEPRARGA